MKIEIKEHGICLVPESDFERNALIEMRKHSIKEMNFEDAWEQKGKFNINYDNDL